MYSALMEMEKNEKKIYFPRDQGLAQPAITGRISPRSRGVPARDHGENRKLKERNSLSFPSNVLT
jgi:hypothetical protein